MLLNVMFYFICIMCVKLEYIFKKKLRISTSNIAIFVEKDVIEERDLII